jgi:hypothetical protein
VSQSIGPHRGVEHPNRLERESLRRPWHGAVDQLQFKEMPPEFQGKHVTIMHIAHRFEEGLHLLQTIRKILPKGPREDFHGVSQGFPRDSHCVKLIGFPRMIEDEVAVLEKGFEHGRNENRGILTQ